MDKNSETKNKDNNQANFYEILERRRKYPRLVIDVPISIKKAKTEVVNAIVHDISIDGIQIRCDRESARLLHPSGKFIKEGKGPKVDAIFHLPFKEKPRPVKISCQIYYLAVISAKVFAFGLMFKKFFGKSAELVDGFILNQIIPVDEKVRVFLDEPRSHLEISSHMDMQVNEVDEVINRLHIKGDIITYEDDSDIKHLKLSSAIASIFNQLERIEDRLGKMEKVIRNR